MKNVPELHFSLKKLRQLERHRSGASSGKDLISENGSSSINEELVLNFSTESKKTEYQETSFQENDENENAQCLNKSFAEPKNPEDEASMLSKLRGIIVQLKTQLETELKQKKVLIQAVTTLKQQLYTSRNVKTVSSQTQTTATTSVSS